jgi:hypothetical protein
MGLCVLPAASVPVWLEIGEKVAAIVSAVAVLLAVLSWRQQQRGLAHQRRDLSFQILTACNTRFYDIVDNLTTGKLEEAYVRQYIDLCHEELFYAENSYIEQNIVFEWLDGMLGFLPVWIESRPSDDNHRPAVNAMLLVREQAELAAASDKVAADAKPHWARREKMLRDNLAGYDRLRFVFTLSPAEAAAVEVAFRVAGPPAHQRETGRIKLLQVIAQRIKQYPQQSYLRGLKK